MKFSFGFSFFIGFCFSFGLTFFNLRYECHKNSIQHGVADRPAGAHSQNTFGGIDL